ncbi:acetyl-CoA synthetase-like protein [Amylostereum chailletii]|nr:acetyl-CoA synthetase-like protein [Amylostereum chailletii]
MVSDYLVRLPTFQGSESSTFCHPPIGGQDGCSTVPELYKHHATKSPTHPLFVYADDDGDTRTITYSEAHLAIRRAARIVSNLYHSLEGRYAEQRREKNDGCPSTIGLLSIADSITTFTTMVGIMHLGRTPFPISTRNSASAVAHLVKETGVLQLLVSPDPATQRLSHEAADVLASDGYELQILPVPQFPDLYNNNDQLEDFQPRTMDADHPVLILHTSGSTAFPKPIRMTNRNFMKWGFVMWYGQVDLCGYRLAAHSLPLFHGMAAFQFVWTTCTGLVMACFKPCNPPVIPTSDVFLSAVDSTRCEIVFCVPSFVEAWARNPENFEIMKRIKAIVFGGAPLNKNVGDKLVDLGIVLVAFFGLTETGAVSLTIPASPSKDWEYFRISPHLDVTMVPQEGMPGIYELIILDSPTLTPHVTNTVIDGTPAYASSDLLQEHPTQPNFWRAFGRADDQLALSTGEKSIFIQDTRIAAAIVFGNGRFQNGVLIQPTEPFDPADVTLLAKFRNDIWVTMTKVNDHAPSHSRIFKEMIVVTHPNKPMEFTAKGTPRRHVSLKAYEQEIETLYDVVKDSSQSDLPPPNEWTPHSTKAFVGNSVRRVVQAPLTDDNDIFQYGCDSLQATWIRNTVIHAFGASNTPVHDIPQNFVYSHPTIRSLSEFTYSAIAGKVRHCSQAEEIEARAEAMNAMVKKYTDKIVREVFPDGPRGHSIQSGRQTVLLTGSTGRLGCHLLVQIAADPTVERIFALNRVGTGEGRNIRERQVEALERWKLDSNILSGGQITLVGCEYGKPRLGLDEATYSEVLWITSVRWHRSSWRVDFNVGLTAFEPLVASLADLIELAASSPVSGGARLVFVSSISVTFSMSSYPAAGFGYGESKWVAEQVLLNARQALGIKTTVVRVGQLSGDTRLGGWNTKEWVPALLSLGKQVGALPSRSGVVTWRLLEMVHSPSPVLHLISPRPVEWNVIFSTFAEYLNVPLAPYDEWLVRAEKIAFSPRQDHTSAHSLFSFFKAGVFGEDVLGTNRAIQTSTTLANMGPLGREDALVYAKYWEKHAV